MKKRKYFFIGIGVLGLGVIALTSCGDDSESAQVNSEDTFTKEAISAYNTINYLNLNEVLEDASTTDETNDETGSSETTSSEESSEEVTESSDSTEGTTEETETTEETTEETVDMTEITELIDKGNILAEKKISLEKYESDKEGYLEKQVISYDGKEYVLYVSESETVEGEKKIPRNKTEYEVKTNYSGILLYEDQTYEFIAKHEDDNESDGDIEEKLKLTVNISDTKQVIIKDETETEEDGDIEEKYSCRIVEDGQETEYYKVSREYEDDEYKIKINENGVKYTLKYYTEDEIDYLKVKYDNTKYVFEITTEEIDGVATTTYNLVEEAEDTKTKSHSHKDDKKSDKSYKENNMQPEEIQPEDGTQPQDGMLPEDGSLEEITA
ncbi:MAG: hypothetical protein K6E20_02175 [Acholeplasmatales bacterium]|nr:hypothetical protein [Acholeplasmatales bacterium]